MLRASGAMAVAAVGVSFGLAHAGPTARPAARCGRARAGQPAGPAAPAAAAKPWEAGTSEARREEAYALFVEGNDHFVKRRYPQALDGYQRALAIFAHPRIHLSMVRTLLLLGRPAEAHEHLVAALRFGAPPFEPDEYAEALEHRSSLERQLGQLVVSCDTPEARLTLDGQHLVTCPGTVTRVVMPGRHEVVGTRRGYLTATREVVGEAGRCTAVSIQLATLRVTTAVTVRRWTSWKPWAVLGGGALVAAAGIPLQVRASSNMDRFRQRANELCGTESCELPASLRDLESRAELQNRVAITAFAVGAAGIAAGAVLLYVNRERTIVREVEAPPDRALSVVPLGPDAPGLGLAGRF